MFSLPLGVRGGVIRTLSILEWEIRVLVAYIYHIVPLKYKKHARWSEATCGPCIVSTFRSCYFEQLPAGAQNNPRAPWLWPRGSLSCAVAMDMVVVASLSFSRGPPEGIQSFNNYAGIFLFAPVWVCLWVCASVRKQAWTFGSWRLSRACAYQNTSASRAPGTDARVRPPQHIDLCLSLNILIWQGMGIFDTTIPTLKMSMQCTFIPRDDFMLEMIPSYQFTHTSQCVSNNLKYLLSDGLNASN